MIVLHVSYVSCNEHLEVMMGLLSARKSVAF